MIFEKLKLDGSYLVKLDPRQDNRGFFSRLFCENEFKENGTSNYSYELLNANNNFAPTGYALAA